MERVSIKMEDYVKGVLGDYAYLIIGGSLLFIFKSTIESAVEGLKIFLGNDLNTDDVIHFDGKPARVVRVGIWKTILFVYSVGCANGKPYIKGGNKVAIQNGELKSHIIEKPLPMLDLSKWDDCEDEK
tara:strand:+ start:8366 stop:8749 length:384 start_codon:yes stop_codon:yes gene_type:complete